MLSLLLTSCATGPSLDDVKGQVAFDKNCPENKVRIVKKRVKPGHGTYKIKACGKKYIYKHTGTVVYEKGKGPMANM